MSTTRRTLAALALFALAITACAQQPEYPHDGWHAIYGPGGGGRD
jgi:hypothetical protein